MGYPGKRQNLAALQPSNSYGVFHMPKQKCMVTFHLCSEIVKYLQVSLLMAQPDADAASTAERRTTV